ncbi:MAG: TetR/AcrR family transcriptional regulator [Polaromonas sp.]
MAYRPTEKTQARKAVLKKQLLDAALFLVAGGGFNALTITAVAQQAGIATGAVYKHFKSKAELCAEVFRLATGKEVAVVRETALREGAPATRLLDTIETFAMRAMRGQRLAYALIAEPVDTLVDAERLRYRQDYADIFRHLVEQGIGSGDFPPQVSAVSAAALVGAITESLVGPLSWQINTRPSVEQTRLIRSIQAFCLRAVAMKTLEDENRPAATLKS